MKIQSMLLALILCTAASCSSPQHHASESTPSAQDSSKTQPFASQKNDSANSDSEKKAAEPPVIRKNPDMRLNSIAQILGGVMDSSTGTYAKIATYPGYKRYAANMNANFQQFRSRLLNRFGDWSKTELADVQNTTRNVFYPFSGPDIAYAYSLAPGADNYYMFGLEPIGFIPDISENAGQARIDTILNSMTLSVRDNMRYSFFITKHMSMDLRKAQVKGITPVLLFFMANLDLKIVSADVVEINQDGDVQPVKSGTGKGIRIGFIDNSGSGKVRYVHYFSENISDGNGGFLDRLSKLTSRLPGMITFVKSSSYCMHGEKSFSKIRNIILGNTQALIQDDTGIPYSFLNNSSWKRNHYGKYTRPISIFAGMYQADFRAAMDSAKAINFKFGYNTPSNILVVRRVK
jgi:hypothetical protein